MQTLLIDNNTTVHTDAAARGHNIAVAGREDAKLEADAAQPRDTHQWQRVDSSGQLQFPRWDILHAGQFADVQCYRRFGINRNTG